MDANPNKKLFIHLKMFFLSNIRWSSIAQVRARQIIKGWLTMTTIRSQQDKIKMKK
jgi:hypothetical protein